MHRCEVDAHQSYSGATITFASWHLFQRDDPHYTHTFIAVATAFPARVNREKKETRWMVLEGKVYPIIRSPPNTCRCGTIVVEEVSPPTHRPSFLNPHAYTVGHEKKVSL